MERRIILLMSVLLSSLSVFGQPSQELELNIQKIEPIYNNFSFKPKISFVNLPVSIKISDIEYAINNQIKDLLYEDNDFENNDNDNLKIKAWKKQDIKISANNTTIYYYVPLKIWVQMQYKVLGINNTKTIEGAIAFNFETSYSLKTDWTLETQTTVKDYKWLETPTVDLGITKLSVKFIADQLVAINKRNLSKSIDTEVRKNLDLKKYAQNAWKQLQTPVQLDTSLMLWLKITPESITMTPLIANNGEFSSTIGVECLTECVIDAKPTFRIDTKLPDIVIKTTIPNIFSVNVVMDIPYAEAENVAQATIVGQTFTEGKHSVTVEHLEMYGQNDRLVVQIGLSGKVNGDVFLAGKLVYKNVTQTIEITDFDFDIQTKNILHKSADWLFHTAIVNKIQPYMSYSLAATLYQTRDLISRNLNNYQIIKGVNLSGSLKSMDVEAIYLTPQGIRVSAFANGQLDLKVDGLSF